MPGSVFGQQDVLSYTCNLHGSPKIGDCLLISEVKMLFSECIGCSLGKYSLNKKKNMHQSFDATMVY